ncbi:type II secretion system protein E [Pirellula staleyi DSM 6068]|uniref:Type II secretion system protein E n=1 Tax=Pirellula staleyi (strain ATCC 27377 / DSM 6068 / ICPB 4128) TaxID=530564 RepID=D2QZA7_PIRSD|nr:GspE/PulE family protein [Pirellula staleyi]ADB18299.1 type II secretion system protein E [Pirellula staleyi DSM 6068]
MSHHPAPPQRLGNILIERGYLTVAHLQQALDHQQRAGRGKLLGEILVELSLCTEDQVMECLAQVYCVPYAKLEQRLSDPRIVELLPREYIEKNLVFPLFRIQQTLTVAVTEPSNLFLLEEIRGLTGLTVQIVASSAKDIRRMITTLPDSKTFVIEDIIEDNSQTEVTLIESAVEDISDSTECAGQSPVIRLVNYVIYHAVKEGASDIHIEPAERCVRVRYRIDGKLYKSLEVPLNLLGAVTSRIKIMASLDISERRLPQDGRVHVMLDGRKVDLRVSTFPGNRGEKTVIRVLDTRSVSLNLRDLGFAEDILTPLQQSINAPNGIVLVTGPTGSGKSTTLYAALNEIASMENNICTVEDPIEYHLPLINQFQVQERVGLTFSKALRTLLRQDPDVIMVGEVRDDETARTAIQAALTGHLVFSTLHTNDAASAITRLINMGVEPYLIGAALNAVLAQRLVRRICGKCREAYDPPRTLRKAIEKMGYPMEKFFKGAGCRKCRNTGYSGRVGVHELLIVNDELRDAIVAGKSVAELRRIAAAYNMVTLRHDGFRKVREGLTSVEEVIQIAGETVGGDRIAAVELPTTSAPHATASSGAGA